MKDAISLGVGEPDFDTPWHIREEGIYSLEKGRTFYTSNAGLKDLKIEICNYLKRRFDVEYDYNKEVMVTVGGSEAIDIALRAMLNPGDEVLIPQPSYVSYTPCTILADGVPVTIQLEEWDRDKEYDRLGLHEEYTEYLGNKIVCHSLPIRPGRNLAIIVESAAVNHRQKKMGYNAAEELYKRVQANIAKKRETK